MKKFNALLLLAALLAGTVSAQTAMPSGGGAMTMGDAKKDMPMAASADMTDGEIRKVDLDNKKITIKHGEIKNLDMPGMTMVFQVKEPALLEKAKVGDKVRFKAEKSGGAIMVTDIQPAK
ncbi:MAG: copper-binding protein [Polaromonas sp.]|nr:copper-binding protein [Polaromonas sp.]